MKDLDPIALLFVFLIIACLYLEYAKRQADATAKELAAGFEMGLSRARGESVIAGITDEMISTA